MSYGIYLFVFIVTALPVYMVQLMTDYVSDGTSVIGCFLLNPVVYLMEFITQSMTQNSAIRDMIGQTKSPILNWISSGYWWLIISPIAFLLVSALFLAIAKKRISPVSRRKARKLAKKMGTGNTEH